MRGILQVVVPALQLVLVITSQLPDSVAVRDQANNFFQSHANALGRILDDAADGRRCDALHFSASGWPSSIHSVLKNPRAYPEEGRAAG